MSFCVDVVRDISDCIAFVRGVFLSCSRVAIAPDFVVRDVTTEVVGFCVSDFCLWRTADVFCAVGRRVPAREMSDASSATAG